MLYSKNRVNNEIEILIVIKMKMLKDMQVNI